MNAELISFECVRPIESHARLIMQWRNDPETLHMSYHKEPKIWESFFPEFLHDYFAYPDTPPLFILYEGQRAGFLRFRPVPHPKALPRRCCDISINVAPSFRGIGLGQLALKEIQGWLAKQGIDDLYAEIKPANFASQKAFEQAGFIQLEDGSKIIEGTDEKIAIKRYIVPLTPTDHTKTSSVYIIAEAGSNWRMGTPQRDLAMAKTLINIAADAGANAVKFQTYRPETTYVANAGQSDYLSEMGVKEDISAIFADLAMPYEMVAELAALCHHKNIDFMSTSFSPNDFKAIDPYVKIHKIASYEIGHIRLIELAAQSGKPLLLSTGAATEEEIAWAVKTFKANGGKDLTLLQCTAKYPADEAAMHLRTIPWLNKRFQTAVGLSDHSRDPLTAPIAAVALGATAIEKHFTLNNALPGPDHAFAVTPTELKALVQAVRSAEKMRGSEIKIVDPCEMELRAYARRGIQAIQDIQPGDILHEDINIAILRPGKQPLGVHPKYLADIQGKAARRFIALGSGLQPYDW